MIKRVLMLLALFLPTSLAAQEDEETIVLRGVIDGLGTTAYTVQDSPLWTAAFRLVAWRVEDEAPEAEQGQTSADINTHPLRVEIPNLAEDQLRAWQRSYPPRTLVRLAIRAPIEPGERRAFALWHSALDLASDADPELVAAAATILNPPPFVDEELGTFTPDETFPTWFQQDRQWLGAPVSITLSLIDGPASANRDHLTGAADTLRALEQTAASWDERMRKAIVDEYYTLWVETWRDEKPLITREAFGKRFAVEQATLYPDGGFRFYFSDDGLFYGHSLEVSGSIEEGISEVSLVG